MQFAKSGKQVMDHVLADHSQVCKAGQVVSKQDNGLVQARLEQFQFDYAE